jgi:hypothetical protein
LHRVPNLGQSGGVEGDISVVFRSDQARLAAGIVKYPRAIGVLQKPRKLLQRPLPALDDFSLGHMMSAFGDAYSYPLYVQVGRLQDHVDQANLEAAGFRGEYQISVLVGGKNGFDTDGLMGFDGSLQPRVYASYRFKICLSKTG